MLEEIFRLYSQYSGRGILMVLFFMVLFYLTFVEKNQTVRTVLLYGSIALIGIIFLPVVYFLYVKYVDATTYWRMWWMIPTGIGLAYAGTQMVWKHRWTGLVLIFIVLVLGGDYIYLRSAEVDWAENIYQIPDEVVEIADFLEDYDDGIVFAAFPPEMLIFVRQYDVDLRMPYGRERLDPNWSGSNGFYLLMSSNSLDFHALAEKCRYNYTRYIIVDGHKQYLNAPDNNGFALIYETGRYRVYEYLEVDWEQRQEDLMNQ